MRRRFDKTSRFFQIALWLFVAASFADFANLDDIFLCSTVLHSEEEVTAQSPEDVFLWVTAGRDVTSLHPVLSKEPAAQHNRTVAVDQDSPSLAAGEYASVGSTLIVPQEQVPDYCRPLPAESLYLKLRALLI